MISFNSIPLKSHWPYESTKPATFHSANMAQWGLQKPSVTAGSKSRVLCVMNLDDEGLAMQA